MTAVPLPGEGAGAEPAVPRATVRQGTGEGDGRLLARARGGDRTAFGDLVRRHHRMIASLVLQRIGRAGPVEDLVQETFTRALVNLDGFRGSASFSTWTATIALNLSRDWIRKQSRRRRLAPSADVEADAVPAPAPRRGERAIETREEADRIRAAMSALPERVQIAITMRVLHDAPYAEIAERLATRVPTARTWVSRGLKAVREMLEVHDDQR